MGITKTSRVRIEGIEEMMKNSKAITKASMDVLGKAALAGADIIRDDARSRAPQKSGNLKRGIISAITWERNTTVAFAGAGMDRNMNNIFVKYSKSGKRYYYPSSVEYGHKGAPPHPFLRPALDSNRTKIRKAVADVVKAAIEGASK